MALVHQLVTSEISKFVLFCPRITIGAEHLTMKFVLEYFILKHLRICICRAYNLFHVFFINLCQTILRCKLFVMHSVIDQF